MKPVKGSHNSIAQFQFYKSTTLQYFQITLSTLVKEVNVLIRTAILATVALLIQTPSALAFDFTVTPTAGACDPQGDCNPITNCSTCQNPSSPATPCSFQEALNIAQCNQEDDTLNLDIGNYDASAVTSSVTGCGLSGFCYVGNRVSIPERRNLTILGAGAGQTVIDGNSQPGVIGLRVFALGDVDSNLSLVIRGLTIQDVDSNSFGAGLVVSSADSSTSIEENEFLRNDTAGGGGGVGFIASNTGSVSLNRNAFYGNSAYGGGGGAFVNTGSGTIDFTNNILAGNSATTAGDGGGANLASVTGSMRVVNNTFFDNEMEMDGNGGGLWLGFCDTSSADVYNNIIYGNTVNTGNGDDIFAGQFIFCGSTSVGPLNLFNNDFSEFISGVGTIVVNGFPGSTNLDVDPQWVDSSNNDFHLAATSPVIDMGDLNPPFGLPTPDFDGVTRPQGALPDMGALELPVTPSPSASPTPTAIPLPGNFFVSGNGCSLGSGNAASPFLTFVLFASTVVFIFRRRFQRN